MSILVQKYGGTSVGTIEKIKAVARRIIAERIRGQKVVVVVSAMQHTTDELIALAKKITGSPPERELDMLLTAGERIAMALLSMAIWDEGHEAISLTGSQSGIITEDNHTRARILEVRGTRITEELEKGRIVIVAGFQGVSGKREITTLGRGGSDTTAVALSVSLGAQRCEIYTDVPGVFTADPNLVPDAKKLEHISYDEMLDFAYFGASVVHPRAVELARRYKVPLFILGAHTDEPGTLITEGKQMEEKYIKGITSREVLLVEFEFQKEAELEKFLQELIRKRVPVDRFACKARDGKRLATFICDRADKQALEEFPALKICDSLSVVAIVGYGIAGRSDLILEVMKCLNGMGVMPIELFQTHTSLTFLVPSEIEKEVVKVLHRDFIVKRRKYGKV